MTPETPQAATSEEALTRRSPMKKYALPAGLLAGGVALGMAFAPVGLAGAQEDDSDAPTTEEPSEETPGRRGHRGRHGLRSGVAVVEELTGLSHEELREGFADDQSLADQALAAGVSQDELVAAIVADIQSKLDDAVEAGRLTQAEADEKSAELEERVTSAVTTVPSEREHHGRRGHRGPGFEALEELGLTREEIRAGFEAGNSLAETAAEQGISEDQLVDALVAQAMERADAAVEAGRITQEQADEKLAEIEEKITERVNADPEDRPNFGRHGRRGFGPNGNGNGNGATTGISLTA